MSWDVTLNVTDTTLCPHCGGTVSTESHEAESWNYTHNTNAMIAAAYEAASGEDGARYLGQIIKGLESDPERYRAMNPENGWGDYDRLLGVLREMQAAPASHDLPTTWQASG